jgi:hypothetical protein
MFSRVVRLRRLTASTLLKAICGVKTTFGRPIRAALYMRICSRTWSILFEVRIVGPPPIRWSACVQ